METKFMTEQEYYQQRCNECKTDNISTSYKEFISDEYCMTRYFYRNRYVYKIPTYDSYLNGQVINPECILIVCKRGKYVEL